VSSSSSLLTGNSPLFRSKSRRADCVLVERRKGAVSVSRVKNSRLAKVRYRRKGVIGRAASEGPLFDGERPFVVAVVGFRSCSLFGHSLIVAGLSQLGGEPTFRLRGGAGSRLPGADQAVAGGVRRQRLCDSVSGLGWGFPSRSVCGMAHQPAQFLAPAVQPRADGAERDIKNLSDRAVAQAVQTD
jgi:hypothetical protein